MYHTHLLSLSIRGDSSPYTMVVTLPVNYCLCIFNLIFKVTDWNTHYLSIFEISTNVSSSLSEIVANKAPNVYIRYQSEIKPLD